MNFIVCILLLLIQTTIGLPIGSKPIMVHEEYGVQIDRLVQLVSTHIQFDHLDAVISNTDKEIAIQFQHHIRINIQDDSQEQILPTLDIMDLEILKSQISAAIQAHTEGSLPLTWDKISDKLSRQAIESYLRQILSDTCSNYDDVISSQCLIDNSKLLANNLDNYITTNLAEIFQVLDQHALPDLLNHTAEDLKGILKYFNSAFLSTENRKFVLDVIPWIHDSSNHHFISKLLSIALHPSNDISEQSHSTSFFIQFADMARV